jgi:YHS domain-containing protein/thioredoxin-related protein
MNTISHSRVLLFFTGLSILAGNGRLSAAEVQWTKDLQKAAAQSSQENKPMLVLVSAQWCGYCQKMLKTTFRDEALIGHLNQCFVPVYLDADDHPEAVQKLEVEGLPTTLIISPEMKVVERLSGYQSAEQVNVKVAKVCNHAAAAPPVKGITVRPVSARPQSPAMFDGTCLVSLRDDGKLVKGRAEFSSRYKDAVVYFATSEHKRRFDAQPELYWPVADGICLVSHHNEQTVRQGAPVLAMIYADRVWFFADQSHQDEFVKNPKTYLRLAANSREASSGGIRGFCDCNLDFKQPTWDSVPCWLFLFVHSGFAADPC